MIDLKNQNKNENEEYFLLYFQILSQQNINNIDNNNKNPTPTEEILNEKQNIDGNTATNQTTKRCVNNNCLSTTPYFNSVVKNINVKNAAVVPKLAYKVRISFFNFKVAFIKLHEYLVIDRYSMAFFE